MRWGIYQKTSSFHTSLKDWGVRVFQWRKERGRQRVRETGGWYRSHLIMIGLNLRKSPHDYSRAESCILLHAARKQHLIAALGNILQHKLKPASMGVIKEISIHRFLLCGYDLLPDEALYEVGISKLSWLRCQNGIPLFKNMSLRLEHGLHLCWGPSGSEGTCMVLTHPWNVNYVMEEPEVSCLQEFVWEWLSRLNGSRNNCDVFPLLYWKWNCTPELQQGLDSSPRSLKPHRAILKSRSGFAASLVVSDKAPLYCRSFYMDNLVPPERKNGPCENPKGVFQSVCPTSESRQPAIALECGPYWMQMAGHMLYNINCQTFKSTLLTSCSQWKSIALA